ncbi:uncharacterized protein VP01_5819g1 [Puccinia sorghi]|uniref:Retrotransposon gag domain-containing protein n=1 Tax=Puccinia sorghi TaxID=27349 RepID=A0A0L6UK75_9BASI|nr:uncharacterized protein VP01_5819g1 [Puccinia sorghi]
MEQNLWQTQACLNAMVGQPHPAPTHPHARTSPSFLPNPNPLMGPVPLLSLLLATLASTLGVCNLLHEGLCGTLSQPYLKKVFNGEPVVFSEFINHYKSSFFNQDHHHCTQLALQNLCQTGTVLAYTQYFNSQEPFVGLTPCS